jgi:lipoprotein-releasing system ATP-binding protein
LTEPVSLQVIDVHKRFVTAHDEVEVLRGVSFEMAAGESLAVLGPSGSGKSTLLHLVGTLDPPSSGQVRIGGRDPYALSEVALARFRNENVGFVFQDHHLLPQYSVIENVLVPTVAFPGGGGENAEQRARELLDRVDLGHRLEHRPAELSGGERQRVAVARALVNRPGLLLCDEPTGSLDQATAARVAELLMELHEAEKTILILVTHSLGLAGHAARRFELTEGRCSAA